MEVVKLYNVDVRGNKREWTIHVVMDEQEDIAKIITTAGQVGGKQTQSIKKIKSGKNIGKANETTKLQQAVSEAKSMIQKKIDAGMSKDENNIENIFFPMLAQKYKEHMKKITFPAFVQPKLDGIRAFVVFDENGTPHLLSRKRKKLLFLNHIIEAIEDLDIPKTAILDGELYTHDLSFEKQTGLCRKTKGITSEEELLIQKIKFNVFDVYLEDKTLTFASRHAFLKKLNIDSYESLTLVETHTVHSHDDIVPFYEKFVADGFEGLMARNNTVYEQNKRSYNLQKWKEFDDSEFEVIGFKEGTGGDEGSVVWECRMENNNTFEVRPRGSLEKRTEWFENGNKYIGKQFTVRYQGFTSDGVPRFPVGIEFRDYE